VVQPPYDCFKAPDVVGDSEGDPRRHAQPSIVVVYCEDVIENWSSPKSAAKAYEALVFSTRHRPPLLLSLVVIGKYSVQTRVLHDFSDRRELQGSRRRGRVACFGMRQHSSSSIVCRAVGRLLVDALRFVSLGCRSRAQLAAENLFLRKQLALYQERRVKSRRADDATRITLVVTPESITISSCVGIGCAAFCCPAPLFFFRAMCRCS
jgi:hypothetical protein